MSEFWNGPISDHWEPVRVLNSESIHRGAKWNVVVESVDIGGHQVRRDVVVHPGAVAIVVLDHMDRVYLIRQYRQPLGAFLFETPAGLLDDPHEFPLTAAQRELAEEAGLVADTWHVLIDFFNSPGGSSEAIRVYLARGISQIVGGRHHTGEAEEMELPGVWLDLDTAVNAVLDGSMGNPTTVVGVLAAQAARGSDWNRLREAESQWQAREMLMANGRLPVNPIEGPAAVV
jgi:ADP-ribose pyrophosphatase